jgi:hypothetical protein
MSLTAICTGPSQRDILDASDNDVTMSDATNMAADDGVSVDETVVANETLTQESVETVGSAPEPEMDTAVEATGDDDDEDGVSSSPILSASLGEDAFNDSVELLASTQALIGADQVPILPKITNIRNLHIYIFVTFYQFLCLINFLSFVSDF